MCWRDDATALQIGHRQGKSFIHRCLRRLCCSSNVGRSVASVLESANQRGAMADSLREELQAHTWWHSLYGWHTAPFYLRAHEPTRVRRVVEAARLGDESNDRDPRSAPPRCRVAFTPSSHAELPHNPVSVQSRRLLRAEPPTPEPQSRAAFALGTASDAGVKVDGGLLADAGSGKSSTLLSRSLTDRSGGSALV